MKKSFFLVTLALFTSFLFLATTPVYATTTCPGLSKDRSTGERQPGTFGLILCIYDGDLAEELLNWEGGGNSRDKSVQNRLQKDGTLSTDVRTITIGLHGISMKKGVTYIFFSGGRRVQVLLSEATDTINIPVQGAGRLILNIPRSILRIGWCVALREQDNPLKYNNPSRCFTEVGELDPALRKQKRWNWVRLHVR